MKYSLENFRIFEEPVTFNFAPLTCLVGKNNSGKSTVTKSIMLFQNFLENIRIDISNHCFTDWKDYQLDFTVGNHRIGSFDQIGFSSNHNLKVSFTTNSKILDTEDDAINTTIVFVPAYKKYKNKPIFQARIASISIEIDNKLFYHYNWSNKDNTPMSYFDFRVVKEFYLKELYRAYKNDSSTKSRIKSQALIKLLQEFYTSCTNNIHQLLMKDKSKEEVTPVCVFHLDILRQLGPCSTSKALLAELDKSLDEKNNNFKLIDTLFQGKSVTRRRRLFEWLTLCFDNYQKLHPEAKFDNFYKYYEDLYISKLSMRQEGFTSSLNGFLESNISAFVSAPQILDMLAGKLNFFEKIVELFSGKDADESHYFPLIYALLESLDSKHSVLTEGIKSPYQTSREFANLLLSEIFLTNDKLVNAQFVSLDHASAQRMYLFEDNDAALNHVLSAYVKISEDKSNVLQYTKGLFLNHWINRLTKFDHVEFEYAKEAEGIYVYFVDKQKNLYTLADVGYGMTPLLLMLIQIELCIYRHFCTCKGDSIQGQEICLFSTIYIEEPGCNMHPCLQAELAEMFLEAYEQYQIEFVLETHSEYLIRKLQTIVHLKPEIRKIISIHYLEEGKVCEMPLLANGGLGKMFGPGFFDIAMNLAGDLYKE